MKSLKQYIQEGGQYKEFYDEDTGEIVTMWVPDIDPEEELERVRKAAEDEAKYDRALKKDKEIRAKLDPLEDEMWGYQEELNDIKREYKSLRIDMEEELGPLYVEGNEAEAEERAQEYGERMNELEDRKDELLEKIKAIQPKIDVLSDKLLDVWSTDFDK